MGTKIVSLFSFFFFFFAATHAFPRVSLIIISTGWFLSHWYPLKSMAQWKITLYFVVALSRPGSLKAYLGSTQLQPLDGPPGFFLNHHLHLQLKRKKGKEDYEDDDIIYTSIYKDSLGCKDWNQDGPLNMEALNMLHADAVKFGAGAKVRRAFQKHQHRASNLL